MQKKELTNLKVKLIKVKKSDLHKTQLVKYKHPKRLKHHRKTNKKVLFTVLFFFIASVIGLMGVFFYVKSRSKLIPTPEKVFPELHLATEIYDRYGTQLYRLYGDDSNSDELRMDEVTQTMRTAFLIAEDSEFYNHPGFNPEAMVRCLKNLISSEKGCGASTITQQLIKITTKQNQLSLQRKIDEVLLSISVEKNYNKDEILLMYLKVTPYGSNITSIKTAANFYFGIKDLKQLTLAQTITLVSIVNNPANLSPTLSDDPQTVQAELDTKRMYLLDQLTEKLAGINAELRANDPTLTEDPITQTMIDEAKAEKITYIPPVFTDIKAGHFVNYAINELQKRNYKNGTEPFTYDDLQNGGYKIYTSLDYDLQQTAEWYVKQAGNNYSYLNMHNAALITVRPGFGEIITMAGSKDFYGQSEDCSEDGFSCKFNPQVNILTSKVSPGSTNKPLGYYIAYRDSKLFPGSFLPDIPIKFGDYIPRNWDGGFYGYSNASAKDMLRYSRNIPALQVVTLDGVGNYIDTARQFGYTSYDGNEYGPSIILGGAEVTPMEHVQAYGVFANGGDMVELNPILRIDDKDGNIIYQAHAERKRVADTQAVWLLNQSLYRLDSLGGEIAWDDRDIAGKTGTTENNRNAIVMMYSPDFVTFGWGGNNNNDPLDQNNGWPAVVVLPWLKNYMNEMGQKSYFNSKTAFIRPDGVYYGGGDCIRGQCLGLKQGWLISGREPARGDVKLIDNGSGGTTKIFKMPVPELQGYLNYYSGKK